MRKKKTKGEKPFSLGKRLVNGGPKSAVNCVLSGVNKFRLWYPTRGIDVASRVNNDGMSLIVEGGRATAAAGLAEARGKDTLVQLYPTLVRAGRVIGVRGEDRSTRAGVGILRDGRVALFASGALTLPEFAAQALAADLVDAGYTDGGGSTALFADVEGDGRAEIAQGLRGRRVISWVTLENKSPARNVVERAKAIVGVSSDRTMIAGAIGATLVFGAGVLAWSDA